MTPAKTRARILAWVGLFIWLIAFVPLFNGEIWRAVTGFLVAGLVSLLAIALTKGWIT